MEIFKIENLSFSYPEQKNMVLNDVSFTVSQGEFLTICGLSGSGKSTLLRQLKTSLAPHGTKSGKVYFMGSPIEETDELTQAAHIGFVMQSPDDQCVTDKVWHELAFVLENLGTKPDVIRRKVGEMVQFFGLNDILYSGISELSGGRKQIVNLASCMIGEPSVLILDEPTAQLDPAAAELFIALLKKIHSEFGTTVIICEHTLELLCSVTDRIIVMSKGRIESDGSAAKTAAELFKRHDPLLESMPVSLRIAACCDCDKNDLPMTVGEGKRFLKEFTKDKKLSPVSHVYNAHSEKDDPVVSVKNVFFRYDKKTPDILKGLSFSAYKGEITAVTGSNGSGKTTLLHTIAGILRPYSGAVNTAGKVCLMPQDPKTMFLKDTVEDDLYLSVEEAEIETVENIISFCGLDDLRKRNPYDLSGGEQQKAALAKVLLHQPDILLLDEPVKGMDVKAKAETGALLKSLAESGVCVIIVSHDIDLCAEYADRCAFMFDGDIVSESSPDRFFSENTFFTTSAARMAQGIIPNAVTANDIRKALSLPIVKNNDKALPYDRTAKGKSIAPKPRSGKEKKLEIRSFGRSSKLFLAELLLIFAAIPLTIYTGVHFLGDAKYLFISLLIMLECTVPFFAAFENRHIRTRELVLIAVMCAMAVASRAAFYMLPQFKPITAAVIIAGAALGAESGFMIGSMSMLLSNVLFGQGPWTPWQMFSMGLIGFLSGVLFGSEFMPKNKYSFALFGVLSCIIIYGGIMNPAAMIMSHMELDRKNIIAFYAAGFPLDIVHGASTAVFLFLAAVPVIRKIERVKLKYGLTEHSRNV